MFINCPAQENTHIDDVELDRLVAEIDRLIFYGAKGDLLVADIPADVLSSVNKIKETL